MKGECQQARLPRSGRAPVAEAKHEVEGVAVVLGPLLREVVCPYPLDRCRPHQVESEGYPIQREDPCIQSNLDDIIESLKLHQQISILRPLL